MAFTFFFRDLPVLEYAVEHMVKFSAGRMRVKIWDAGCAMGQETYTLAIILAEKVGHFAFKNLRLDATDYDSANHFGKKVQNAVYPYDELKRIPEELFKKYFESDDKAGYFKVVDTLCNHVFFQYHDLLSFKPIGSSYSLIVCKNVLLHFQHDQRVEVIKMFHNALLPGGYFTTEQTQNLPDEVSHLFEQVVPDAKLFRKL
jgi:chemotaxis protein methyltransferase CheR